MLSHKICQVFMVLIPVLGTVRCYPNGIGVEASCASLIPQHGSASRTSAPPYNISFTPQTYAPGTPVQVTISSCSNTYYMGFMLQARRGDGTSDQLIGSFTPVSGTRVACSNNAAVVHSSSNSKTSTTLTWTPPTSSVGHIVFRVTFVQSEHTYWTNIVSGVLYDASLNISTSTNNLVTPTVLDVNCTSGANDIKATVSTRTSLIALSVYSFLILGNGKFLVDL